jgi:hypothetical protein
MGIRKTSHIDSLTPLDIKTLNQELEPFGFAYNQDQDLFLSIMYPWQRRYGYGKPYDDIAPFISLIIDCEPIYFKYNNKDWLVEFWKGQYGMTTGSEIGIYTTSNNNDGNSNHIYDSATNDECLSISYVLKKNNKVLFTRSDKHWWLTGFKLGLFSKPSELVMDIVITLETNEMLNAFLNGLKKVGYQDNDIKIIDNSIFLTFSKPHSIQPKAKRPLITYFMQYNNKQYVKIYNSITKDYDNTLDKLNFIRKRYPIMYAQIMNFGKTAQLFKSYISHKHK